MIRPASSEELAYLITFDQGIYLEDAVALDVLRDWQSADPNIFLVYEEDQVILGCLTMLLLTPEAMQDMINFQIIESDLTSAHFAKSDQPAYLYLASIIKAPDAPIGTGKKLIQAMRDEIKRRVLAYPIVAITGYAVTPVGHHLCRKMGMRAVGDEGEKTWFILRVNRNEQ